MDDGTDGGGSGDVVGKDKEGVCTGDDTEAVTFSQTGSQIYISEGF